jgi:transcriptional regulator with XRE-family HTH domain
MNVLGKNIRELREAKNLEQQELARRVGIKPVQQWKYESGRVKQPNLATLHRMAHELGVTIDRLLEGVEIQAIS